MNAIIGSYTSGRIPSQVNASNLNLETYQYSKLVQSTIRYVEDFVKDANMQKCLFTVTEDFLINELTQRFQKFTLKVLVATTDAQWEGMGDVGLARYEPALLPPCPTIRVLSCSN